MQDKKKHRKRLHAENHEGWAVSYSDLLMVLMSFFIIYFNINDQDSSLRSELNNVVFELSKVSELKKVSQKEAEDGKKKVSFNFGFNGFKTNVSSSQKIKRELASYNKDKFVETIKSGFNKDAKQDVLKSSKMEINIDLPKNLYQVGEFSLNSEVKRELDNIFGIIKKSKGKFNVIFVGHTDKTKFDKEAKRVINNNLILSSMRAAKAVEYALERGFDEDAVFVQGLNNQPRNTRSLSIKLVER